MAWLERRKRRYFIAWREGGRRHRSGGDSGGWRDKIVARQKLADWERARARGEAGLVDPYREHRTRPIIAHLADYIADLEAKGRDDVYVYVVEKLLAKLIEACGWKILTDITADSFCQWRESIAVLDAGPLEGLPKLGPRSQNQYLGAARSFLKWAVKRERLAPAAIGPMLTVEKVNETADVRRARRALAPDEQAALLAVPGMTAEHERVYRFIWATGLRRDEAAKLVWGDLHLDCTIPYLKLRAKTTKARRADTLPLHPELVKQLQASRGKAPDGARVFQSIPSIHEHWSYIDAAGIARVDDQNRRADFHATRTTFITAVALVASPSETKELARHTDMRLTLKHYVDPKVFNLAGAVNRLSLPAARPKAAAKVG